MAEFSIRPTATAVSVHVGRAEVTNAIPVLAGKVGAAPAPSTELVPMECSPVKLGATIVQTPARPAEFWIHRDRNVAQAHVANVAESDAKDGREAVQTAAVVPLLSFARMGASLA